jgi:hypothetical protein
MESRCQKGPTAAALLMRNRQRGSVIIASEAEADQKKMSLVKSAMQQSIHK